MKRRILKKWERAFKRHVKQYVKRKKDDVEKDELPRYARYAYQRFMHAHPLPPLYLEEQTNDAPRHFPHVNGIPAR